jgi:hypothetical protein
MFARVENSQKQQGKAASDQSKRKESIAAISLNEFELMTIHREGDRRSPTPIMIQTKGMGCVVSYRKSRAAIKLKEP